MKIIIRFFLFIILTLLTQVGGLIYLTSLCIYQVIRFTPLTGMNEYFRRILFHITFYLLFTFLIIPNVAVFFGRVPMPLFTENNIGPRNILTVIFNRHYVRPELKAITLNVASEMGQKYPGLKINYFDAGHPFYKGYPLIPHLSHNDGKKLDLGFVYNESKTGILSQSTPSLIGYGISEEPIMGEYDRPAYCDRNPANWMYSFMKRIYPQGAKSNYTFNPEINKSLIQSFAKEKNIRRILLEPHLKKRLRLNSAKIIQVQCGSVRHDDHFHIQIR